MESTRCWRDPERDELRRLGFLKRAKSKERAQGRSRSYIGCWLTSLASKSRKRRIWFPRVESYAPRLKEEEKPHADRWGPDVSQTEREGRARGWAAFRAEGREEGVLGCNIWAGAGGSWPRGRKDCWAERPPGRGQVALPFLFFSFSSLFSKAFSNREWIQILETQHRTKLWPA